MIGILSFLQHKTALIDILIAHHLSIVADLEPENAEQTRRDCFKYIDEAIDIFMRVSTITVTARKQGTFLLTLKPLPSSQMGSFFFFFSNCTFSDCCQRNSLVKIYLLKIHINVN